MKKGTMILKGDTGAGFFASDPAPDGTVALEVWNANIGCRVHLTRRDMERLVAMLSKAWEKKP